MTRADFPSDEELSDSISFEFQKSAIRLYFTGMASGEKVINFVV